MLGRLSKGEPLTSICRDDHMPGYQTVADWRDSVPGFSVDFARARDEGFDAIAAETMDIADDGSRDYKAISDREGNTLYVPDQDVIQRSKLRVETRFKLLSKWDPKRYGERVELRHGDPNGNALAPATISLTIAKAPEDE